MAAIDPALACWYAGLDPARQQALMADAARRASRQLQRQVDPDPADWLEVNFWIPEVINSYTGEVGGPISLDPYQRAVLREAYRRDNNGNFIYSVVVWSDIKKSAKSSIAAGVALHRAHLYKWGSLKIIANDLKQADSRVAYYLRRAVKLNPQMRDEIKMVNYKTTLPNETTIEAIPIDPAGEAGGNDDLIVFSELWAARHRAMLQMWTEMTLSPTKFGRSQRWIETYAGYTGESPILEQLYERGVSGQQLDLSYTDNEDVFHDLADLEVYAEGGLLMLWNTRPRLVWQTEAYYTEERGTLQTDEFRRVHRNQWISSSSKFVPNEWWAACQGTIPADLPPRIPFIIAADAGISGDCFGLLGGSNWRSKTYIRYVKKWVPPVDGTIDFTGTPEDPGPELEIMRLLRRYGRARRPVEVRYDPTELHDMMTRIRKKFPEKRYPNIQILPFDQGKKRSMADKQFYDKIREERIVHDGDPDLEEHVQNANAEIRGDTMRIVKRTPQLKIDLAVCGSMLSFEEQEKKPEKKAAPGVLAQGKAKGWGVKP